MAVLFLEGVTEAAPMALELRLSDLSSEVAAPSQLTLKIFAWGVIPLKIPIGDSFRFGSGAPDA